MSAEGLSLHPRKHTQTSRYWYFACLSYLTWKDSLNVHPEQKVTKRKSRMASKFSVETFIYRREWNKTQAFLRLREWLKDAWDNWYCQLWTKATANHLQTWTFPISQQYHSMIHFIPENLCICDIDVCKYLEIQALKRSENLNRKKSSLSSEIITFNLCISLWQFKKTFLGMSSAFLQRQDQDY